MSAFSPPPPHAPFRRTAVSCNLITQRALPRRLAERVAISRSVVIFADYLSDLAVLDALTDITTSPHPTVSVTLAVLGVAGGVLAADLLTGLAALTVATLPTGLFDLFGRDNVPRIIVTTNENENHHENHHELEHGRDTVPRKHASGVVTEVRTRTAVEEVTSVRVITSKGDIFERLLNSCFVTTPPLTIFTGWAADASGDYAVFAEAFFVTVLSLSALAPILRAGGNDCELIAKFRTWGLLKRHDVGWCQVCGVWDSFLDWGFRRKSNAARRPP